MSKYDSSEIFGDSKKKKNKLIDKYSVMLYIFNKLPFYLHTHAVLTVFTLHLLNLSCKIIIIQTVQQVFLFLSGPSSIECLPETKDAGGSYPGAGGTLTRVLSVHGESCGFEIDTRKALNKY